jgi:ribosomal protein S27AE
VILPSTWHQRAVVDALLYLARENSLATNKKQKLPCRRCGKETAVATYDDRYRHAHKCPHGNPCPGGNSYLPNCPACVKAHGIQRRYEERFGVLLGLQGDDNEHNVGKAAPNSPRKS